MADSDLTDFFPVFTQTEDDIREEMDFRANEGISADSPEYVDTREGSFFFIATQPAVIKFAEFYDALNQAVAASTIISSWEATLDRHAESFGTERLPATASVGVLKFSGATGTIISTGTTVSMEETEDFESPSFRVTEGGTIDESGVLQLQAVCTTEGQIGNVGADTVKVPQTTIEDLLSVTNENAFSGGSEVEDDTSLITRLQAKFRGEAGANVVWYEQRALEYPGVGEVTVVPEHEGPGTVLLIVLDDESNPVDSTITDGLKDRLDPITGKGAGLAPISHNVTVTTAIELNIAVSATVTLDDDSSLDGDNATQAVRSLIQSAVVNLINALKPGESVVYNQVLSAFFQVPGVINVSNLTLNGDSMDVVIATDPPQVAVAVAPIVLVEA